ncbi:MAG: hypothetical protein F4188_06300 [Chloroflexi bacterium]|nr:hypothetical protein [Chloroflexota bacterium]
MAQPTDSLPYVPPPTDPSDPHYEEHQTMLRESQRNWEYFEAHELEIFEDHPNEIAIVYGGGNVQYCAASHAVGEFLASLEEPHRSAVVFCTNMSADVAWAL